MLHDTLPLPEKPSWPTMESMIAAVEIWHPDHDGQGVHRADAVYQEGLSEFRDAADSVSITAGEDLIGTVCETKRTVAVKLNEVEFSRRDVAIGGGLRSALVIPVVEGDSLIALVAMFCRVPDEAQGAFEVWRLNRMQELQVDQHFYANLERFEDLSRQIRFPRGSGLPGKVWDETKVMIVNDLGHSPGFARPAALGAEALDVGIGLPVMQGFLVLDSVILFLSAKDSPLAERFEVWMREREGQMRCVQTGPKRYDEDETTSLHSIVEEVSVQRMPILRDNYDAWQLGLPIFLGKELTSVLAIVG